MLNYILNASIPEGVVVQFADFAPELDSRNLQPASNGLCNMTGCISEDTLQSIRQNADRLLELGVSFEVTDRAGKTRILSDRFLAPKFPVETRKEAFVMIGEITVLATENVE